MSTEQAGDVPERSVIGFVPDSGADGEAADDRAAQTDATSEATRVDSITGDSDSDETGTDDGTGIDDEEAVYYEDQVEPEYGILGFTLRELVILGAWAVSFIVSFFPVLTGGASVWTSGIDWILTIGVPTAAVFLVVLRRLSPEGIRRVGSLGIDQFASVAAAVAGTAWAQVLWHQVTASLDTGVLLVGWVPIVAQIAALVLIAATVFAPLIPRLREDFEGRMETLAHRNADPVRPVIHRPRPRPAAAVDAPAEETDGPDEVEPAAASDSVASVDTIADVASDADADATRVIEVGPVVDAPDPHARQEGTSYTDPIGALHEIFESNGTVVPGDSGDRTEHRDRTEGDDDVVGDTTHSRGEADALLRRNRTEYARPVGSDAQPFWILASTERDVLDERGQPLYRIGPSAWTLVIEDRDGAYVVRHDDGRIGYLHDLTDITKG